MRKTKYALRWNFRYISKHGLKHRFLNGLSIGPLLFYKKGDLVWRRLKMERDVLLLASPEVISFMYTELQEELFSSVPYDFGAMSIDTYTDYSLDCQKMYITVEAIFNPLKKDKQ